MNTDITALEKPQYPVVDRNPPFTKVVGNFSTLDYLRFSTITGISVTVGYLSVHTLLMEQEDVESSRKKELQREKWRLQSNKRYQSMSQEQKEKYLARIRKRNQSMSQEQIEMRRLRDRERIQSLSPEQREQRLARRRETSQMRRDKAKRKRLDSITEEGSQETQTTPTVSEASSVEMLQLANPMWTMRLTRLKQLARTLNKSSTTDAETRERPLSQMKAAVARSTDQPESSLSHSQTQAEHELQ